jgi:PAS domain S-box-containing protein
MIDREDGIIHLRARTSSPTRPVSSFIPENLLPQDVTQFVQKAAAHTRSNSELGLPTLSPTDEHEDYAGIKLVASSSSGQENEGNYDLKPPPPSASITNGESLAEQLFSADHLNLILHDHTLNNRFTSFLNKYRPQANPILVRYQATQKAKAAIQYANSIAEGLAEASLSFGPTLAAIVDRKFEAESRKATEELVSDALPAYVTHRLVAVVTECLVKEITGTNVPFMHDLIPGLAEVYCLTDPSVYDNPVVYASEEFYRTTQYGREYVIGRNCRFLQGPKSSYSSVKRLIDGLASGTEVCETILNYRRDGTPFINLLTIAPLCDNKGRIRYFLGCQIDVTNLVEGGRGLESMQRLTTQDRSASRFGNLHKSSSDALGELSRQFSPMELDFVRNSDLDKSGRETPHRPSTARRRFGMEDVVEFDRNLWPVASGPSGRFPGVYQNVWAYRMQY